MSVCLLHRFQRTACDPQVGRLLHDQAGPASAAVRHDWQSQCILERQVCVRRQSEELLQGAVCNRGQYKRGSLCRVVPWGCRP